MDLFRIIINKILYKIPLKLLILILIFLFLAFFCFNAKQVKAVSSYPYDSLLESDQQLATVVNDFSSRFSWYNTFVVFRWSSATYVFGFNNDRMEFVFNNDNILIINSSDTSLFIEASYHSDGSFNAKVERQLANGQVYNTVGYPTTAYVYSTDFIYNSNGVLIVPLNFSFAPEIVNSNDISTWSFDNLIISGGDITGHYSTTVDNVIYQYVRTFKLEITYRGVVYTIDLRPYMTVDNNDKVTFTIPRNELSNHFNIYNGNSIMFDLFVQPDDNPNSTGNWSTYSLGTYTFILTTEEQEQINSDSNKQVLGDINSSIQETNENLNNLNSNITELNNSQEETNNKIDNLQDTITNTDVPDYYSSYEEFAENYTGSFANLDQFQRIWQILYNAFYSDEITNLTVTIPFTNRQMTISSDIVANVPNEVKSIIALISYGFVVVYIMKDIRTIINTFSSGHIEKVGKDVKKGDL